MVSPTPILVISPSVLYLIGFGTGIIFANAGGPPAQSFIGLSQVCVPFAGPLARLDWAEGILVVDLDMGIIEEGESSYKIRADLAREDWHYDYRHTHAK